MWYSKKG